MRALPAAVVVLVVLSGCLSALTLPDESPHTETADGSVHVVEPGETVRVGVAFEGVREVHPESTDGDAVAFEAASFSPGPSSVAQSLPPYYVWEARTDVDGVVEYSVAENADPGDYELTVTAWASENHSHDDGTSERFVIRVTGDDPSNATAHTASPGETVSVTQSFGNLKRLHVESVSAPGSGSWQDSIRLGTPQLDPAQSYQEDSYPPRHMWDSPTDVNATHTFFVQEDATPGVYRFAVVPEHGYGASDGEPRAVVIRVVEDESG